MPSFFANPRSVDRLNTVCSGILLLMLATLAFLAFQPSLNPQSEGGMISVEAITSSVEDTDAAAGADIVTLPAATAGEKQG